MNIFQQERFSRIKRLDSSISWTELTRFLESKALKTSYLWLIFVPISAKFLSHIPEFHDFLLFGKSVTLALSLPFSWKMFFFSALFFSLANILHSLFCPDIIKKYPTFESFQKTGQGFDQIRNYVIKSYVDFPDDDHSRNYRLLADFGRKFIHKDAYDIDILRSDSVTYSDLVNKINKDEKYYSDKTDSAFWFVKDHQDNNLLIFRILCVSSYFIGSFLIFCVICQNIYYVFSFI